MHAAPQPEESEPQLPAAPAPDLAQTKKPKRGRPSKEDLLRCEWKDCSIWRRLIWDDRISAPAFRYWHYLRNQMDMRGYVREYYASMRVIEVALDCKHESVKGWNKMLDAAGYLTWETDGKAHRHRYRVLDGFGRPAKGGELGQRELPIPYGIPANGVPLTAHAASPIGADGVSPTAHASYIEGKEVKREGKGNPSRELWHVAKDIDKLRELRAQVARRPPSTERTEKLGKIAFRIRQLENEAIGYDVPTPNMEPIAEAPKKTDEARQTTLELSPSPDEPGPQYGTPEYEEWKKQQMNSP